MIDFNGTNYYIGTADSANMPGDSWCVVWRYILNDLTGSGTQDAITSGAWWGTGAITVRYGEDGQGGNAWRCMAVARRDGESAVQINSASAPGPDGLDRVGVWQNNNGTLEMWFCPKGGTPSLEGSAPFPGTAGMTAPYPLTIGTVASDLTGSRPFDNILGDVFIGHNFALSAWEIEAIANGRPAYSLGRQFKHNWPFREAALTQSNWMDISSPMTASAGQEGVTVARTVPLMAER